MPIKLGIFYFLAAFTIWAAGVVVLGKNIVRAAVALIFSFCGMAALYILLDAEFLAAVQVLIYVGGITILLLFAIMLTSRISARTARSRDFGSPATCGASRSPVSINWARCARAFSSQ